MAKVSARKSGQKPEKAPRFLIRNFEFTAKDIEQIQRMATLGLTAAQMSAILGFDKATFYRLLARFPEALQAKSKGEALAFQKVAETAFEMATSGKDTAMTIFYLKTRGGWRESTKIDLDISNIDPMKIDKDQLIQMLPALKDLVAVLESDDAEELPA